MRICTELTLLLLQVVQIAEFRVDFFHRLGGVHLHGLVVSHCVQDLALVGSSVDLNGLVFYFGLDAEAVLDGPCI